MKPHRSVLADLHLHTTASDGQSSPAEVVALAARAGLSAIAVTDHDTLSGLAEARAAAGQAGILLLPGIERSVGGEEEIHLLGLGFSLENATLHSLQTALLAERRERMLEMLDRLSALGMPVAEAELGQPGAAPFMGRMNLARAMVRRGYVENTGEAMERYIGNGRPAYVPRRRVGVCEGIETIKALGGVVSLAHPGRLAMDRGTFLARLPGWVEAGLQGLEAYHPSHAAADAAYYDKLARRRGLLVTGGSDFHGAAGALGEMGAGLCRWKSAEEDLSALLSCIPRGMESAMNPHQ